MKKRITPGSCAPKRACTLTHICFILVFNVVAPLIVLWDPREHAALRLRPNHTHRNTFIASAMHCIYFVPHVDVRWRCKSSQWGCLAFSVSHCYWQVGLTLWYVNYTTIHPFSVALVLSLFIRLGKTSGLHPEVATNQSHATYRQTKKKTLKITFTPMDNLESSQKLICMFFFECGRKPQYQEPRFEP